MREEGTLWGDSFQGGPECSLSAKAADREGGTARESKNEPQEKERSAAAELAEENAGTCFEKMDGICPVPFKEPCQSLCVAGA